VTCRLASVTLVASAALADAAGAHALAYYALVGAVPVSAVAALCAFGDVLDGSAAAPRDRNLAVVSALTSALVLLAAASRAPLVEGAPPPSLGTGAVVASLSLFGLHALLAAASWPLRTAASWPPSPPARSAAGRGRTTRP